MVQLGLGTIRTINREYVPVLEKGSYLSKWTDNLFGNFNSELSKGEVHQAFKNEYHSAYLL
jgi:hypothetical protein